LKTFIEIAVANSEKFDELKYKVKINDGIEDFHNFIKDFLR